MSAIIAATAERLRRAYGGSTLAPLRDVLAPTDGETAYQVQEANTRYWLAQGRRIVGRKVGLTSKAVQAQLGVDQPDFGVLFDDMAVEDGGTVTMARLIRPRAEAEVALVLGQDLVEGPVTAEGVARATDHAAAAIEIVDSRIQDWKIKIQDTVADNASCGVLTLGGTRRSPRQLDLALAGCDALFAAQRQALELPYPGVLPEGPSAPKAFGS